MGGTSTSLLQLALFVEESRDNHISQGSQGKTKLSVPQGGGGDILGKERPGAVLCAWGRVGDVEKTAFFEGQGKRKLSREELADIVPQPLFHPSPNQASPFLVNNLDGTILLTVNATSQLSW